MNSADDLLIVCDWVTTGLCRCSLCSRAWLLAPPQVGGANVYYSPNTYLC